MFGWDGTFDDAGRIGEVVERLRRALESATDAQMRYELSVRLRETRMMTSELEASES